MEAFPKQGYRNPVVRAGDEQRFGNAVRSASLNTLARRPGDASKADVESKIGEQVERFRRGSINDKQLESAVAPLKRELDRLRSAEMVQEHSRLEVLRQSSFIFATCGSASSDRFRCFNFDLLIVHSAHDMCEATSLLALQHARRVVLIGDHEQMQPVVADSNRWAGYNRSFYERLVDGGRPIFVLNTQQVYHPALYREISQVVYSGLVTNGDEAEKLALFPFQMAMPIWWPNTIVNVKGSETVDGTSNSNTEEVSATLDILKVIFTASSSDPVAVREGLSIALLSPYGAQHTALEAATKHLKVPKHVTVK